MQSPQPPDSTFDSLASTQRDVEKLTFESLSGEILAHVFRHLNPIDIIAMRMTSRELYRTSNSKLVWVVALEELCDRYGIYKPTFPIEEMTIHELEHAALSPYRFAKFLKAGGDAADMGGPIEPRRVRNLSECQRKLQGTSGELFWETNFFLIPGGRFLITTTGENNGLCLWDLGYNSTIPVKRFPLATVKERGETLRAVGPGWDGESLLVATIRIDRVTRKLNTDDEDSSERRPLMDYTTVACVYRVRPLAENPEFELEGQLTLDGIEYRESYTKMIADNPFFFSGGETLVIHSKLHLIVWNWTERTGCTWKMNIRSNLPETSVYVGPHSIVTFHLDEDHFRVWEIPDPQPFILPGISSTDNLATIEVNTVKYSFQGHLPEQFNSDQDFVLSGTPKWQHHLLRNYMCSVFREWPKQASLNYPRLNLYSIDHTIVPQSRDPQTSLAEEGSSMEVYSEAHGDDCPSGVVQGLINCDDSLVLCTGSAGDAIVAVALPIPRESRESSSQDTIINPSSVVLAKTNYRKALSLCPFSGRLVYFHGRVRFNGLRLADYLAPPKEVPRDIKRPYSTYMYKKYPPSPPGPTRPLA